MNTEDSLIKIIKKICSNNDDSGVVVGIGDDAAAFGYKNPEQIVTTDMLVENVHFRMDFTDAYQLGWKAAAVNLSDIAAMGAMPTHSVVSIGLPTPDKKFVSRLYEGIVDISSMHNSSVVGGDTVKSPNGIVINITQFGLASEHIVLRTGAKAGYFIMVTGTLGDSLAGLKLLLEKGVRNAAMESDYLVMKHLKPEPLISDAMIISDVAEGRLAMMDISDGLAADLTKLCEANKLGAIIYEDKLPISTELEKYAAKRNLDPYLLAAEGGEDYELLICADKKDAINIVNICGEKYGIPISIIGELTKEKTIKLIDKDGKSKDMPSSWEHF